MQVETQIFFYKPLKKEVPESITRDLDIEALGIDLEEETLYSSRMAKDGEIFHSEYYAYRRSSCSYFVLFQNQHSHTNYGKIRFFFKNPHGSFAVIRVTENLGKYVCQSTELPVPEDPVIQHLHQADLLGSHFIAVGESNTFETVKCENILSRVVFFPFEDADDRVKGYVSTVLKTYQHN